MGKVPSRKKRIPEKFQPQKVLTQKGSHTRTPPPRKSSHPPKVKGRKSSYLLKKLHIFYQFLYVLIFKVHSTGPKQYQGASPAHSKLTTFSEEFPVTAAHFRVPIFCLMYLYKFFIGTQHKYNTQYNTFILKNNYRLKDIQTNTHTHTPHTHS